MIMEAKTVSEMFRSNSMFTWPVIQEYFITLSCNESLLLVFKMLQVIGENATDVSTRPYITVIGSFKGYGKR
jgi:hypothetical protein